MSVTIPTGTELRAKALDRVKGYVCKDRQATHGDAEDNFKDIAKFWSTYKGIEFTDLDVAAMMALVKISRLRSSPLHQDNWDDGGGYMICGAGLAEKRRLTEGPQAGPAAIIACSRCKAVGIDKTEWTWTNPLDGTVLCKPCYENVSKEVRDKLNSL